MELGAHYGISYTAFCEAVLRLQLPTRCCAVDNWQPAPHAGAYGEDVYADLKKFHDKRHASFSQLVRRIFDDACKVNEIMQEFGPESLAGSYRIPQLH